MDHTLAALVKTPEYQRLIAARKRLAWPLLFLTFGSYMTFILAIAFQPQMLGASFGGGVISWGIMLGLGLIVLMFLITFHYARQTNRHIEPLIQQMQRISGSK